MAITSWLQNSKIMGNNVAGLISEGLSGFNFATPAGDNAIPNSVLTKAQKTFSSNAENPNLPKPKTLYFVHFNLNPNLVEKIKYKQRLIETLSGQKIDGDKFNTGELGKAAASGLQSMYESALSIFGTNKNIIKNKTDNFRNDVNANEELKAENSTVADYIPSKDILKKLSFEMSKLVKSYNKPGVSFTTSEFNEYNRKRIVYKNVTYDDVTVTFFDVKDNPVQQFFNTYLKFICSDFLCKSKSLWEAPMDNNHWKNKEGYTTVDNIRVKNTYIDNLNSFGFNIDSNFRLIDSISFCEYYMDRLMVYTIENPVITKIKWGDGAAGDFSSNDIQITFKYEGITNDLVGIEPNGPGRWKNNDSSYKRYMVNKEIRSEVATFLQTRYQTLGGSVLSDITSILKGYMNGDTKFSWNTLKNQALDTARKYGMANEANTLVQAEQTIKNYTSKDGTGRAKYLINMATDPTSLIGRVSGGFSSNEMRGQFII